MTDTLKLFLSLASLVMVVISVVVITACGDSDDQETTAVHDDTLPTPTPAQQSLPPAAAPAPTQPTPTSPPDPTATSLPPTATNTPAPEPTATPTPTSTPTPEPTNTPAPSPTPTLTPSPERATATATNTPTAEPTATAVVPTTISTQTPTLTATPTPSPERATATATNTPTTEPTATATSTSTPLPTVQLAIDAKVTLGGYWSDGTANVEILVSLRNEGKLQAQGTQPIAVTCRHGDEVISGCGLVTTVTLTNGFGPTDTTLSFRVPMGDLSFEISYDGTETEVLNIEVPERIVGVKRDVWECFSDTSSSGTFWEEDEGIGCAGWSAESIKKWAKEQPLRVAISGGRGFVAEFEDALQYVASTLDLQFEVVDPEQAVDIRAYVGLTIPEAVSRRVACFTEAFGCAEQNIWRDEIVRSRIVVYNLWPHLGTEFGEFDAREKKLLRHAMVHELVHALSTMSHRTEVLSIMNSEAHDSARLSPMDEALLRLYLHELVKPGMKMEEIERLIVFEDQLLDPQSVHSQLEAWMLLSNAYTALRKATTAGFQVRSSLPDCSEKLPWSDYEVGNLTSHSPYFGWSRIGNDEIQAYGLRAHFDESEHWRKSRSGWEMVNGGTFSTIVRGWRGDLSDPHYMLETILKYANWADIDVSHSADGWATIRVGLEMIGVANGMAAERIDVAIVIDRETYSISEYSLNWTLNDSTCGTYIIEAREGRYGIDFSFPHEVRQSSSLIENCEFESLGILDGYTRRYGHWARECQQGNPEDSYVRPYGFSLKDWSFVRFDLTSPDETSFKLLKVDDTGFTEVELSSSGVVLTGPYCEEGQQRSWAHIVLPPGEYIVEALTYNRTLPGSFTFWVTTQSTPPPPLRFKSVSVGTFQTCGLLTDGTPLCWGMRNVEGGGSEAPPGDFELISRGGHKCAIRTDGTPVCWDFVDEGEHTCQAKENGGIYCTLDGQAIPSATTSDRDGGTTASRTITVIAGYYDQTPPPNLKLKAISVGWTHACALQEDGTPVCWGSNQYGKASPPPGEKFTAISSGTGHTCALRIDGTATCWGLGINQATETPRDETFIEISVGLEHSCGLREDGVAVCWGDGGNETCTLTPSLFYSCHSGGSPDPVPQSPPEDERLASLSSDGPYCGLRADGTPVCWTKYVDSGLTSPPEGERFTTVSASPKHACALRMDGEVVCWGRDWLGQASPPDGTMWTEIP